MLTDDLLELQRLDTTIDQLGHRRAHLTERATLAEATAALAVVTKRRTAIAIRSAELAAAIEQLEHDGIELTAHRSRLQAQLKTVIAPRAAEALMHELATLSTRRDEMDDQELAHLDEQGDLDGETGTLNEQSPALESDLADARAALDTAEASIDDELGDLRAARDVAAAAIDASTLTRYELLRARLGGVAVARLDGTRCSGCHLDLSTGEVNEVRAAEGLAECPQCGRLLVP